MRNNENGFSLLELSVALGIMAAMLVIVEPAAISTVVVAAQKTSIKEDLTSVMSELQGWALSNPSKAPTATEFNTIKYNVLAEYIKTPALQAQNQAYLNTIQYIKIGDYYCVEATKPFDTKTYTMHYDSLAGRILDGACPTNTLGVNPN